MSDDVVGHYESIQEEDRLRDGRDQLELVRTREILLRHLPSDAASVIDIGGGTGVHARWIAELGHRVHVVDITPRHVEQVRTELGGLGVTAEVGDARSLRVDDGSYDIVLLLGPLYHLQDRGDRLAALREARRVARAGAVIAVAAISRFASLFDGLAREFLFDRDFQRIVQRDLADGCHDNPQNRPHWFTTAYFHRASDLRREAEDAGIVVADVYGVEGMAGWMSHLDERWQEPEERAVIIESARAVECEPSLMGLSAHLLLVGHAS